MRFFIAVNVTEVSAVKNLLLNTISVLFVGVKIVCVVESVQSPLSVTDIRTVYIVKAAIHMIRQYTQFVYR